MDPTDKKSIYVLCFGMLLMGMGGALVNNNSVPALIGTLKNQFEGNEIKNTLSAINTGAFGLGSILGPIIASSLNQYVGFSWAFTIGSGIVLVVGFV